MKELKLGFELAEISKLILNHLRESTENLGVVNSYRPFLFHLDQHNNGLTQSELVELIHFKAPTVSLTIQKMEYEGLVKKEIDRNDQRVTRIFLTDKGKSYIEKIKQIHDEVEEYLTSLYSDEEKKVFLEYISRIKTKIKERKK